VRTIVRRLFRVYAHIYTNHFDQICALGIEGAFYSIIVTLLIPLMHIYKHILIRAIATFSYSSTRYVAPHGCKSTHYLSDVQFDLVDKKELAPLDELNEAILAEDKTR
jgi:MOB kinase activator 1